MMNRMTSEKGIFIARRQDRGSPGYHPNQEHDYPSVRAVRPVLPVSPVLPAHLLLILYRPCVP